MLTVVIPTYQERENLEALISRLERARNELSEPLEVIVVDNDSPDGTAAQARILLEQARLGRVVQCRADLAQAVLEGARQARGDLLGVMDADLSHPPELLPALVRAVRSGADVAVASRYVPGGSIRDWPWSRRVLSRLGNWLIRPLVPIRDATSGYFVTGTMRLRALATDLRGFKILLELLVLDGTRRVQEVPYTFVDRTQGTSKLSRGVLWRYAWQLSRLYLIRLRSLDAPRCRGGLLGSEDLSQFIDRCNRETSRAANQLYQRHPTRSRWRLAFRLFVRPCLRSWAIRLTHRLPSRAMVRGLLSAWCDFLTWAKWWEEGLRRSGAAPTSADPTPGTTTHPPASDAIEGDRRKTLSVVILTKNEEERIARCLRNVAWADEIVVVDGESRDRTPEICRAFGATVVSHAFDGSFSTDRNLGLERARGDWALQIDADDVVTPQFRAAVEALLRRETPHDAYTFRRRSVLLGRVMRYGGWYYTVPNLIRRDRVRYRGRVHERPDIPGSVGELAVDVEHHPCEDLAAFVRRHNRYTSLQVEELFATFGVLSPRQLRRRLVGRPWKTFWKSYVKKAGWREGLHGLVFAIFFAGVELLKWAKYWERWELRSRCPSSS